jgi:hypothetical protein
VGRLNPGDLDLVHEIRALAPCARTYLTALIRDGGRCWNSRANDLCGVTLLCELGADPNAYDELERSPLHCVIETYHHALRDTSVVEGVTDGDLKVWGAC